jgi:hypothetical protein
MADSKAELPRLAGWGNYAWQPPAGSLAPIGTFHEHQIIAASVPPCLDLYQPPCCCQKTSIHRKIAALGLQRSTAQIYLLS